MIDAMLPIQVQAEYQNRLTQVSRPVVMLMLRERYNYHCYGKRYHSP
jgi:hypothetical protein